MTLKFLSEKMLSMDHVVCAMSRPKSSYAGIGTFAVAAINNRKMGKMKNEFERINRQHQSNLEIVSDQLNNVRDLHIASLAGICSVSDQLTDLSHQSWAILEFLEIVERREEALGDLKLFLISVEEEVEKINSLEPDYPEYALLLAENLHQLLENEGVELQHFKRMPSTSDIKWAKSVLDSVSENLANLRQKVLR